MPYKHIDISTEQISKHPGSPCGDVMMTDRDAMATVAVLCDGLGSGIKANIAATMTATRAIALLKNGFSIREAAYQISQTMDKAKSTDLPYAAFTLVRILNTGEATIISYEMPSPILVSNEYAAVLPGRTIALGTHMIQEYLYSLDFGQSIMLVSDGITQAGIGHHFPLGWSIEGICSFINAKISQSSKLNQLSLAILSKVFSYDNQRYGDDSTVCLLTCRSGYAVNVLTGLPADRTKDQPFLADFIQQDGRKIVAGSSTADVLARYLKTPIALQPNDNTFEPPQYSIKGIDLVTEGAVTLNQVYNIVDDPDVDQSNDRNGVILFSILLRFADKIIFWLGSAQNPAHLDLAFRQHGIIPRADIVPMIAKKLKTLGKVVVIKTDYN